MQIRLCHPCRTGEGATSPSGAYHTPRELCASRPTRCSNRLVHLRRFVLETATRRKGAPE
jgi:hypothetical protein